MAKELKDVTKAEDNYSQWYNDLVVKAGLSRKFGRTRLLW